MTTHMPGAVLPLIYPLLMSVMGFGYVQLGAMLSAPGWRAGCSRASGARWPAGAPQRLIAGELATTTVGLIFTLFDATSVAGPYLAGRLQAGVPPHRGCGREHLHGPKPPGEPAGSPATTRRSPLLSPLPGTGTGRGLNDPVPAHDAGIDGEVAAWASGDSPTRSCTVFRSSAGCCSAPRASSW